MASSATEHASEPVSLSLIITNYCTKLILICLSHQNLVAHLDKALRYKPFRPPMLSMEFFIDIILLATLWPLGRLSLQKK